MPAEANVPLVQKRHAVLLSGVPVGALIQRGDFVRFVFLPSYWDNPARPVLGAWFEDHPQASPAAALVLPVWFSNLLPEGSLRDWIAKDRGVSPEREMQLLLRVGADLPGAVEVREGQDDEYPWDWTVQEEPPSGRSMAERMKFSLAGVGLKFSMVRDGDRLTLPGRDERGDWIVKLPDAKHAFVPHNEFLMMSIAAHAGIETPEIRLVDRADLPDLPNSVWPDNESVAYAIERFDRDVDGRSIHIEDFAQVRGFYPHQKYDGAFETVAGLAFRAHDEWSLEQFVRRMALNLLVGNGDAHLKNWSLIYPDKRKAQLSPVYDVVSTAPYFLAEPEPENLGLKFGGSRRFDSVTMDTFTRLNVILGSKLDISGIVEDTVIRASGAWAEQAQGQPEGLQFVLDWVSANIEAVSSRLL